MRFTTLAVLVVSSATVAYALRLGGRKSAYEANPVVEEEQQGFYHYQHEQLRQGLNDQEQHAMDIAEGLYGPYSGTQEKNYRHQQQRKKQNDNAAAVRELRAASRAAQQQVPTMGLSVLDFGAVGDGSTDDTAALQAAFTECGATYKTCLIPAGHYSVTSQLNIDTYNGKIRIVGEGKYNTVIQAMPGNTSGFLPGQAILNISWTPPNVVLHCCCREESEVPERSRNWKHSTVFPVTFISQKFVSFRRPVVQL